MYMYVYKRVGCMAMYFGTIPILILCFHTWNWIVPHTQNTHIEYYGVKWNIRYKIHTCHNDRNSGLTTINIEHK